MSAGVFEVLASDESDVRLASRKALVIAESRIKDRLGKWLNTASADEFDARLSIVVDDVKRIVAEACDEVGYSKPESIEKTLLAHFRPLAKKPPWLEKDDDDDESSEDEDVEDKDDQGDDEKDHVGAISAFTLAMASRVEASTSLEEEEDSSSDSVTATPKGVSSSETTEQKTVPCPQCGGDGESASGKKCSKCEGRGKVSDWGPSVLDALESRVGENMTPWSDNEPYGELSDLDHSMENPQCPMCGGPGVPLGALGNRHHFRCRNCGMDFSHEGGHMAAADGNTGLDGPSPKMNKEKWTPQNVKTPDEDSKYNPTKHLDPVDPIKFDNDKDKLKEIGEKTTERVDLPAGDEDDGGGFAKGGEDKGPSTKTFPKGDQANPVTKEAISKTVVGEGGGTSLPPNASGPPVGKSATQPYNPAIQEESVANFHPAAKYQYERAIQQGSNPADALQAAQATQQELLQSATQGQGINNLQQLVSGANPVVDLVENNYDGFVPASRIQRASSALSS